MLTAESFIGKIDISRILLLNAFWIATVIDLPADADLQGSLLNLLQSWRPGPNNRYKAEEYEE